jgi:hypothetical protein
MGIGHKISLGEMLSNPSLHENPEGVYQRIMLDTSASWMNTSWKCRLHPEEWKIQIRGSVTEGWS